MYAHALNMLLSKEVNMRRFAYVSDPLNEHVKKWGQSVPAFCQGQVHIVRSPFRQLQLLLSNYILLKLAGL
jgi:hypothetical protein